jgi:hypothetical protein
MDGPPTVDWTARVIGTAGVLIALGSLLLTYMRGRTRLKVIPRRETYGEALGAPQTDIVIKVINRSEFPVVIEEAGVEFMNGETRPLKFRHTFKIGDDTESEELPITLAARTSVSIRTDEQQGVKSALILSAYPAKCAYVMTADGYVKRGTSKQLRARAAQHNKGES